MTSSVEVLASSLSPQAIRARSTINDWYSAWGEDSAMRGRISSRIEGQFSAALYELYLHALFTHYGYDVAHEPPLADTARRADFLVSRDDASFYVEATIVGQTPEQIAEENRLNVVLDSLRKCNHPYFMVAISVHTVGTTSPNGRALLREVLAWLSTLDPDDERRRRAEHQPSEFIWEWNGWKLEFTPLPVSQPTEDGILGMFGPAIGGFLTDAHDLHACLARKSTAYGRLPAPYVIAVLERAWGGDAGWHRMNATYGQEAITFGSDPNRAHSVRNRDGFWLGPNGFRNGHVSALLLSHQLRAWSQPLP
ncbi:MAG: hypothetical protein M3P18_15885, partial [Actinomycetota bacterium]|nr:hypothetical protein [Actinomycetota bacterium]